MKDQTNNREKTSTYKPRREVSEELTLSHLEPTLLLFKIMEKEILLVKPHNLGYLQGRPSKLVQMSQRIFQYFGSFVLKKTYFL
jgi:hypothetical protein